MATFFEDQQLLLNKLISELYSINKYIKYESRLDDDHREVLFDLYAEILLKHGMSGVQMMKWGPLRNHSRAKLYTIMNPNVEPETEDEMKTPLFTLE